MVPLALVNLTLAFRLSFSLDSLQPLRSRLEGRCFSHGGGKMLRWLGFSPFMEAVLHAVVTESSTRNLNLKIVMNVDETSGRKGFLLKPSSFGRAPAEPAAPVKQCDENCGDTCDNSRIYLSNLLPDVTIEELRELFGGIGQVARIKQKRGYKDQ